MEHHRKKRKRTHVRFEDRDFEAIKKEAIKLGVSIPEYIRIVLDVDTKKEKKNESKMDD